MNKISKLLSIAMLFGATALSAQCWNCQSGNPSQTQPTAPINALENTFKNAFSNENPPPPSGQTANPSTQQPSFFSHPATQQSQQQSSSFWHSQPTTNQPSTMQDSMLISKVRQALLNNRNIDARAIQVTSDNGKVTLIGIVRNSADKDQAANTAKNVEGVNSLNDQLTTQPTQQPY